MRSIAESQLGKTLAMLLFVLALCVPAFGDANSINIDLKTAGNFGALAGSGVTNNDGNTVINGDVGSSPTPAITGFPPGEVNGVLYSAASAVVDQAKSDLTAAYLAALDAPDGNTSEPNGLSGSILDPNIYTFLLPVVLTGTLTLDGNGDPNAKWLFRIPISSLTTGPNFTLLLTHGASANNVFWQVGENATIDTNNVFAGNILATTSITLNGGTLNGRALARNGAVTISRAETINTPSHGYVNISNETTVPPGPNNVILVYKVNPSLSGWQLDFEKISRTVVIHEVDPTDPNQQPPLNAEWDTTTLTSARPSSSNFTGYIVMDVNANSFLVNDTDPNSDSGTITAHDANAISDGVGFIVINKKAKTYQKIYKTWVANAAKTGWVTDANYGSIDYNGIFEAGVVKSKKGKEMPKKTLNVFGLDAKVRSFKGTNVNGVSTWDKEDWEWNFYTMTGALKKVDIDGSKTKVLVPSSLKGFAWNVAGNTIVGTQTIKENSKTTVTTRSEAITEEKPSGKASMVLNVTLTRKANAGNWTTSGTMDKIIESLPSTYTEVPNVPNAVDVNYDD